MKKSIQVLSLLLGICLTTFPSAQTTDTICVDSAKYSNALKWAYYGLECDSIVNHYKIKDTLREDIITAQREQIDIDQIIKREQSKSIHNLRLTSLGLGGALTIVILYLIIK